MRVSGWEVSSFRLGGFKFQVGRFQVSGWEVSSFQVGRFQVSDCKVSSFQVRGVLSCEFQGKRL